MFGFLNVYKPKGMTSHDVVSVLRRVTGVKQIGHTGTLDPFAEGVLPICIGKATRLIEYLADDKAYKGVVQLGTSTLTYDIEGEVGKSSDKRVTIEDIEQALEKFTGEIKQIPPMYSAIKVGGKKLYEYARKGEEIQVEPRRVSIYRLDLIGYDEENRQAEFYIECSKGTYIRSIANDLGEELGTFGHLAKLVRVKAGSFKIEKSVKLEDLITIEDVEYHLINPLEYLDYPKYALNEGEVRLVSNGMPLHSDKSDGLTVLTYNGELAAVAESLHGLLKCRKVFV